MLDKTLDVSCLWLKIFFYLILCPFTSLSLLLLSMLWTTLKDHVVKQRFIIWSRLISKPGKFFSPFHILGVWKFPELYFWWIEGFQINVLWFIMGLFFCVCLCLHLFDYPVVLCTSCNVKSCLLHVSEQNRMLEWAFVRLSNNKSAFLALKIS